MSNESHLLSSYSTVGLHLGVGGSCVTLPPLMLINLDIAANSFQTIVFQSTLPGCSSLAQYLNTNII